MSIFQQEKREMGPDIFIIPTDDSRLKPATKSIYYKVNKKVSKTWLKERKPRQPKETSGPSKSSFHNFTGSILENDHKKKSSFQEQDNNSLNEGRQLNFYREFRKTNDKDKENKKLQKDKKNKNKGFSVFKKIRNGNTFYNEGQIEEQQDDQMEEINFSSNKEMVSKYIKKQLQPDKRQEISAAYLAKIQDDLSSMLDPSLESEEDVYIELGIADFRGEKERGVAKRQIKKLELEQQIVEVLKPASKYYYSELFNLDSLLERIVSRNYTEEISTHYFQKVITSESSQNETYIKEAFIKKLKLNSQNQLKERELKEKFYQILIKKYGQILCSDDEKWWDQQMGIAEKQERKLDSLKQIRSESLILQERFNWVQKIKNMLFVCRFNYMSDTGESSAQNYEMFKAFLDKTLTIALIIENPSFNLQILEKIIKEQV